MKRAGVVLLLACCSPVPTAKPVTHKSGPVHRTTLRSVGPDLSGRASEVPELAYREDVILLRDALADLAQEVASLDSLTDEERGYFQELAQVQRDASEADAEGMYP